MPGAGPPTSSAAAAAAAASPAAAKAKACGGGRKAPTYRVKEAAGWIYIFPDETRPGSIEQHRDPFVIPESVSREFRAIEGSMDFKGGVDASVENMLDMLHISFVHSFGNQQDPTPFAVSYEKGFDDPGTEAMATSQVTFRYRSGSKSFSKVVGQSTEVFKRGRGGGDAARASQNNRMHCRTTVVRSPPFDPAGCHFPFFVHATPPRLASGRQRPAAVTPSPLPPRSRPRRRRRSVDAARHDRWW